jgi:hypothetical protein
METIAPKKRGRPPKVKEALDQAAQSAAEAVNMHVLEQAFEPLAVAPAATHADAAPTIRADIRAPMREEDPRTRAARRAAELRDHLGDMDEGTDDFYINKDDIPPGWEYEWKRKLLLGAEDPAYQVALARAGWEPVPTARHPSYMPNNGDHPIIERKGMVLMERPSEISDEARAIELRKARNQVRQKEAQLNSAEGGQFERANKDQSLVNIRKSYDSIPIPS